MSIEVATFSRGIQFPDLTECLELVERVSSRRAAEFVVLSAGVYDLTPTDGYEDGGKDELTVFDNGEGIHRTIINPDNDKLRAELIYPELYGTDTRSMPQGMMWQLPTDRTRLSIVGQKRASLDVLRLFSMIRWKP